MAGPSINSVMEWHIVLTGFLTGLSLIVALGPQNVLILRQGIRREMLFPVMLICLLSDLILLPLGTYLMGSVGNLLPWIVPLLTWAGALYLLWFGWTCFKSARQPLDSYTSSFTGTDSDPNKPDGRQRFHNDVGYTHSSDNDIKAYELTGRSAAEAQASQVATMTRGEPSHAQEAVAAAESRRHRRKFAFSMIPYPIIAALTMTWLNPNTYVDTLIMLGSISNQFGEAGRWDFTTGAMIGSLVWFPTLTYGARILAGPMSKPKIMRGVDYSIAVLMVLMAARLVFMAH